MTARRAASRMRERTESEKHPKLMTERANVTAFVDKCQLSPYVPRSRVCSSHVWSTVLFEPLFFWRLVAITSLPRKAAADRSFQGLVGRKSAKPTHQHTPFEHADDVSHWQNAWTVISTTEPEHSESLSQSTTPAFRALAQESTARDQPDLDD